MKYRTEVRQMNKAIEDNDVNFLQNEFSRDPTLVKLNTPLGSLLHLAAADANFSMIKFLIQSGVDVNAVGGTFECGALKIAATECSKDAVKYLLESGALLDTSAPERNPLFGAIYGSNLEVAKLLVEHGIDFRVSYTGKYMNEMDAVNFADERGVTDIRDYLVSLGAQLRAGTRPPVTDAEDESER